ncbi:hypothetical protein [Sphingobium yanoikuyae]|jgi:hypothetical protein|uniref:Uncharacterized protein n=1 Tax=Sphingobium yanoikuyae TaxID=13690 RepID=A0A0J9FQM8_SPHYA|nr:hypothetical protein [Sphingobium yanoikuyae]ATP17620.1 hypothetical protein BV87_03940 [Sphingobium yanoikuyae]KMW30630.1 hypothetical protein BV87_04550 [Sphingobium yanoikuyae]QJR04506.1 hypothetical protein HH800_21265 [Sphingobium yanoikuyae]
MSQPFSRYLHPFEVAHHPSLEPEVKRAILASWASDRSAVKDQPAMRKPPGARRAVPIDEVFAAMRSLDEPRTDSRPLQ